MVLIINNERHFRLGHNIGHNVGWVERSETQQLISVGFRSSTQPTGNWFGLKYDQTQILSINSLVPIDVTIPISEKFMIYNL